MKCEEFSPRRIGVSGRIHLLVEDVEKGVTLRDEWIDNKVVLAGLNLVRDLMGGNNTAPTHIAVGTDNTAPAAGDTALVAEVFRNVITRRVPSAQKIVFQLFIGTGEANGNALVEAGIFNRSTAGDMLSRVIFAVINKTGAITVTVTWEITLSEA